MAVKFKLRKEEHLDRVGFCCNRDRRELRARAKVWIYFSFTLAFQCFDGFMCNGLRTWISICQLLESGSRAWVSSLVVYDCVMPLASGRGVLIREMACRDLLSAGIVVAFRLCIPFFLPAAEIL